jgi:AraC-like DNA-binding protein
MTDTNSFATVRFSATDFPAERRIAASREHYAYAVLKIGIELDDDEASFEATVASRTMSELQLVSGKLTPARIMRTREMMVDGNDDLSLVVNRTGNVNVSARGREVVLGANQAVLMSSAEAFVFDRRCCGESIAIRIPYATLSPMVIDVDDAIMHRIAPNTAALRLLTCYAGTLLDDDHALATPVLRHHVATHVHDLTALTLGATREAADVANGRGIGAARLRAAKIYAIENIVCRDLTIGGVASYLGVTPRYLQRLFENDGTTFSAFLLARRLARVHRMLRDPPFAQRQVGAIAYDVGFGDLSYFNRCFRRLYGATPMDIRSAAAK